MTAAMLPPGALDPDLTATLTALVTVHERDGRATVRTVATAAGTSAAVAHAHLRQLVDLGLAEHPAAGALHPTVTVVAHTPRSKQ